VRLAARGHVTGRRGGGSGAGSSPEGRGAKWRGRGGDADNGECAAACAPVSRARFVARGRTANGGSCVEGGRGGRARGGVGQACRAARGRRSGRRRLFPVLGPGTCLRATARSPGHVGASARVPRPAAGALAGHWVPASAGAQCRRLS
jgi:hypothetical protein